MHFTWAESLRGLQELEELKLSTVPLYLHVYLIEDNTLLTPYKL